MTRLDMANVMDADADAHVTARRIEFFAEVLWGPRDGHKPLIKPPADPWWSLALSKALQELDPLPSSATERNE